MTTRRLATLITVVSGAALLFSACSSSTPSDTPIPDQAAVDSATQKKGDTTISGKLTNKGGKYFLEQLGKQPQEVESYSVDLSTYTDQTVTITGQFSGDTLFAGTVEVQAQ